MRTRKNSCNDVERVATSVYHIIPNIYIHTYAYTHKYTIYTSVWDRGIEEEYRQIISRWLDYVKCLDCPVAIFLKSHM